MLLKRFQTKCSPYSDSPSQKRAVFLAGWFTVIVAVGAVSAVSFTVFSSQQSVAQQSQRTQAAPLGNRGRQPYQAERRKFTRSMAVLKLGMKTRSERLTGFTQSGKPSSALPPSKARQRTLDDYMDAVSVVFSAIAPQHKSKKVVPVPAAKKLTMAETATRFL